MASSSAPASDLDDHRFMKEFNQTLFESHERRKKVIPEVGFNLNDDEYPQIKEQIALRGWRRLAAPMTGISKLLVQEFYANAAVLDEEVANAEQLPYKSFVRGIEVDFSPKNIRRVMRFKEETLGAETDYKTRQATDQRLDEVLADLCIPGATWRLSSSQPAQEDDDEDQPMPQARGGNEEEEGQQQQQNFQQPPQQPFPDFQPHYESQYHEDLQGIEEHLSSMQFLQQSFYENM
ncbi:hypothetical protein PIB30_074774 [Stylosanthes scabra]|uniref:Putative plant transposon protein domain-containing protein n=1 Tax=Stylosanthes scabra TaxID=79078 RepID=A0ABU6SPY2_9FABA|nr:hypothetical protein [Stylosanthes scabra]